MGGGGSQDRAADEAARKQGLLAEKLYTSTDPLRASLIQRSQQFLDNGVGDSATYGAFKAGAEPQYAAARDQVIADTPSGGALTAALANLQTDKARTMTQAQGGIEQTELSRALSLGTGLVNPAMAGMGQTSAIQAQRAEADSQRDAAKYMAIGEATGAILGGGK